MIFARVDRRVTRRIVNTDRTSPADYLVKGIRTLIGSLPGQAVLKPVSDFIFGETEVTTKSYNDLIKYGINSTDVNHIVGLQAGIAITPAMIIVDSPSFALSKGGESWLPTIPTAV